MCFGAGNMQKEADTQQTSDGADDEDSQATSESCPSSLDSRVSLGNDYEGGRSPPQPVQNKRTYKARASAKKPSVRLDRILPLKGLCVCLKAAMFFLGVA